MQLFLPTLISLKENQVKFYSFSNPDENANIFISFTSLSMWGVEFYVSKGKDLRPSPDNYDWSNQDDLSNSIDWWKSISSSKEI